MLGFISALQCYILPVLIFPLYTCVHCHTDRCVPGPNFASQWWSGEKKKKEGPCSLRELKGVTEEGCSMRRDGGGGGGGGWRDGGAWGCVKAMISADQATLLLIGTVETLGCLPPRSNEKPWPPLVSKVTKAYCNCTFSNGVSHARTPTPVMTITIMSSGSTGAFPTSASSEEKDAGQPPRGMKRVLPRIWVLFSIINWCFFH